MREDEPIRVAPAAYVTIKLFAVLSGYSEKAVRRKIQDGVFLEGWEYVRAPDGRVLISTDGYGRWARGEPRER
jgi:hypothetical protein